LSIIALLYEQNASFNIVWKKRGQKSGMGSFGPLVDDLFVKRDMIFPKDVNQLITRVTSTIASLSVNPLNPILTALVQYLYLASGSILFFLSTRPPFTQLHTRHLTLDSKMYAIAKRVPYAAHVIVLFTFAFSAFVLVYVLSSPLRLAILLPLRRGAHSMKWKYLRELILRILCTFSSPFIRSINFLSIPSGGDATAIRTTFGAFGWCAPDFCLPSAIGYE